MDVRFWHSSDDSHERNLPFRHLTGILWTIATSFLIGSLSNLQITRIDIKSWTSLIFGLLSTIGMSYPPLRALKTGKNSDFNFDRFIMVMRQTIKACTSSILG